MTLGDSIGRWRPLRCPRNRSRVDVTAAASNQNWVGWMIILIMRPWKVSRRRSTGKKNVTACLKWLASVSTPLENDNKGGYGEINTEGDRLVEWTSKWNCLERNFQRRGYLLERKISVDLGCADKLARNEHSLKKQNKHILSSRSDGSTSGKCESGN